MQPPISLWACSCREQGSLLAMGARAIRGAIGAVVGGLHRALAPSAALAPGQTTSPTTVCTSGPGAAVASYALRIES